MSESVEVDSRLQGLSDTEIVLNFANALNSLYPHMKAVFAHCYDPYDGVVEPLFYALVYTSFQGKYGLLAPRTACHSYDSVGCNYDQLNYIRVRPRVLPFQAQGSEGPLQVTEDFLSRRELVFKTFGDGARTLTGGEIDGDPYDVTFKFTEVEAFDPIKRDESEIGALLWLPNDAVEYEFVPCPNSIRGAG